MATIATTEGLHPMPAAAYPAILTTDRVVSRQALVSYRGNRYSVPPELACAAVTVTHVLGADVIDIGTTSGIIIARHRLAADGPGAMVCDHGHIYALEQAAMAGANTGRPHRRKERMPPDPTPSPQRTCSEPLPAQHIPDPHALPNKSVLQQNPTPKARSSMTCRSTNVLHTEGTPCDGRQEDRRPDAGTEHRRSSQSLPTHAGPSRGPQTPRRSGSVPSVLDQAAAEELSMTAA